MYIRIASLSPLLKFIVSITLSLKLVDRITSTSKLEVTEVVGLVLILRL
jgi:hypothetical protein